MGYRWRRMYYLTGLPGWLRFGYSPGWLGRSPTGLPPTAQWLIQVGLIPQPTQQSPVNPYPTQQPPTFPYQTKEQEKQFLEQQAKTLESQLEFLRRRLEELKKGSTQTVDYSVPFMPFGYPTAYTPTPEEELASLEEYRKQLDEEVKGVNARIEELRKLLAQKKT